MDNQYLEAMTQRAYINTHGTVIALPTEIKGEIITYYLFSFPQGSSFCKAKHPIDQFSGQYPVLASTEHHWEIAADSPLDKLILKRKLITPVNLEYVELPHPINAY